jgi:hypothetical protein
MVVTVCPSEGSFARVVVWNGKFLLSSKSQKFLSIDLFIAIVLV